jgi:hypothetical protein
MMNDEAEKRESGKLSGKAEGGMMNDEAEKRESGKAGKRETERKG